MIRYPAFDPPEYLDWKPDAEVFASYQATLSRIPERQEQIATLDAAKLIALYEGLLRNRLHDICLKRWVKQGVISKAWLGTGEEAATVGAVHALNRSPFGDQLSTDFVAPMIRNSGACHEMGMPLTDMLRGYLGTADSPTRGRDLHIGDFPRGVIAPISHVGDIFAVMGGMALSFKLKSEPRVALTWVGDGSTKTGIFHEAMNFAAVQHLPIIVIIQNNQVALGTRLDQHHRSSFADWPAAYGTVGGVFDGNNVLDAYAATRLAAGACRSGRGPVLLIAETFRMGGHATHDEREARQTFAPDLFEFWGKRDPIGLYESYLLASNFDFEKGQREESSVTLRERNELYLQRLEAHVIEEVEQAANDALDSRRDRNPLPETAAEGVFAEEQSARAFV